MFWDILLPALEWFENRYESSELTEAGVFFIFFTVSLDREQKKRVTVKDLLQFAYVNVVGLSPEWNDLPAGWKTLHYSQWLSGIGKIIQLPEKGDGHFLKQMGFPFSLPT